MERRMLLFYVVAAVMAVAIILLSILVVLKITYGSCEDFQEICLNPECVQAAAQILSYLDTKIDPCINFYAFACGNFLSKAELSDDKKFISTSSSMYDEMQKQLRELLEEPTQPDEYNYRKILKTYYQACNNVVAAEQLGLDNIKLILEKMGGWPVLDGLNWKGYELEWYEYIYKLKELGLDTDYFVTVSITTNKENSNHRLIKIDLPQLRLPSSIHNENINNELSRIYYHYMISVAKKMGASESRAVDELNHSLELEINLQRNSASDESPLSMTLSEFDDKFPNIPWYEYIRNLMSPYVVITKNERLLIAAPGYISSLDSVLSKTPKRVQANYILWRTIETLIPYLNEELRQRAFAYESAIYDISEKPPRWQQCIHETYNRLPLLLSSLYIQRYFDVNSKEKATILVDSLKSQFINVVEATTKMGIKNKENAVMKASNIIEFIAYPDELLHVEELEEVYDKLKVNSDEYLQSFLNINIRNREIYIKSLRKPVTEEGWFNNRVIAEIHTSYNPLENSLSVSAGSLQGLRFNKNHPDYLNYGGIGFVIAREIRQVFDLWQKGTDQLENLQCFINQYSGFTTEEKNLEVNGTVTLTENIADNTGLRIAYLAYQKWIENNGPQQNLPAVKYTPNQLFWISFAINQCSKETPNFMRSLIDEYGSLPAEFRVIGALANQEDFANDFKCAAATPMNPLNRCTIYMVD